MSDDNKDTKQTQDNNPELTVDAAIEFLKGKGIHPLTDTQIGKIKNEVKEKFTPVQQELETVKQTKTEIENELKELRQAQMTDTERQEAEWQELINSHTSLKEQYTELDNKYQSLQSQIQNKEREGVLLDWLSNGSEDVSLSVREALHSFPHLKVQEGNLILSDDTGDIDPETTKQKVLEWFQGKPVLHKRQSTGPGSNLKTTTPPGQKPKRFDPNSTENKQALAQTALGVFSKQT